MAALIARQKPTTDQAESLKHMISFLRASTPHRHDKELPNAKLRLFIEAQKLEIEVLYSCRMYDNPRGSVYADLSHAGLIIQRLNALSDSSNTLGILFAKVANSISPVVDYDRVTLDAVDYSRISSFLGLAESFLAERSLENIQNWDSSPSI